MRAKSFPRDLVENIIDRGEKLGYLNDESFARSFVKDRLKRNPKGTRALQAELKQFGIEESIVKSALSAISSEEEARNAEQVLQRRFRASTGDMKKNLNRALGLLQRRGFSYEIARQAVRGFRGGKKSKNVFNSFEYET